MKKTAVLSGLMALTLLLGGCSAQQAGGETPTTPPAAAATVDPAEKTTGVGFYFDTVVTITLYGADDTLMDDIWAGAPFKDRAAFIKKVQEVTKTYQDEGLLSSRDRQVVLLASARAKMS